MWPDIAVSYRTTSTVAPHCMWLLGAVLRAHLVNYKVRLKDALEQARGLEDCPAHSTAKVAPTRLSPCDGCTLSFYTMDALCPFVPLEPEVKRS